MIALRNCRVIGALTEGYDKEYADILLSEREIQQIRPCGSIFEGDVEEIDVDGKTVMPGLFELHAHLYATNYDSYRLQCLDAGTTTFNAYAFAKAYLDAGYTTVRDCGSSHNCVAAIRDAVNKGILDGPNLISCGLIITPTETGNDTFSDIYLEADGAEETRKACRLELQKGNDFIKYMASGAFMNAGGDPGAQVAEREELEAAVKAAERKNTYVAAHCHGTSAIKAAIQAGVRTVEHGTYLDDECLEMLKNSSNTYLVPTGAVGLHILDDESTDVTPELYQLSVEAAAVETANINKAYHAGLKLGFGSDLTMEPFIKHPGYEFIARKEYYTFENIDILLQATKNSAEIVGLGDTLGTIKEGKRADLIVVDGNPDEDIYVMTKPIVHVIKDGKLIHNSHYDMKQLSF